MAMDQNKPETIERAKHYLGEETRQAHAALFAILDGARADAISVKLQEPEIECVSLYKGEPEERLAGVAPYLVRLEPDGELFAWAMEEGWGDNWGVFLTSAAGLEDLRQHFRRFLMVNDDEGGRFYFRFYDPRVLRVYLPTCTAKEIRLFFGPAMGYLMESEDGEQLLRFCVREGQGMLESISLLEAEPTPQVTVLQAAIAPAEDAPPRRRFVR
jgi:hypothetical protein